MIAGSLALAACAAPPPPAPPPSPAPAPAAEDPILRPARYLVEEHRWIERTDDGLDRVVAGARRLEVKGSQIVRTVAADPELDGGARVPTWAPPGAPRYLFWKGKQLFGADRFDGDLRPLGTLPSEASSAFDWLGGTGLYLNAGVMLVPFTGAPGRLGVPAVVRAVAADARRAVAITALGYARLTTDGGATWRDASAELAGASSLEVRGDALVVTLRDGRERLLDASGAIRDVARASGLPRGKPPPDDPDPLRDASYRRPLDLLLRSGLPLADGGVVVAHEGLVGRFDPLTRKTTSFATLDPGLAHADCAPVRVRDGLLLACVDHDHAAVVDITGAPRTERTFDLGGASDIDRFVAVDGDALAFLGSCDGPAPHVAEAEVLANGEPRNASRQRTPVVCVRAGRDTWVEHRLDPGDASDVIAWIPRPGGGAVALTTHLGNFLDERQRVGGRGALRVVRLPRGEPPLSPSPWTYDSAFVVTRTLRALPDDTVVGWLPSNNGGANMVALRIDPSGHARVFPPPPRAGQIASAGRFAFTVSDDGRTWETSSYGERWAEVDPPPGKLDPHNLRTSHCSLAGCQIGPFVRMGWDAPDSPKPPEISSSPSRPRRYQRPPPVPPLVRLSCSPAGVPEGRRTADSGGFGYTPQPQPRGASLMKIGSLGYANMPWTGRHLAPSGEAELAWIAPLDVTGTVRRLTLDVARIGIDPAMRQAYEMHVGALLGSDGALEGIATGWKEQCLAPLLEAAGIARPLGGCADEPSVGVDLGGHVVVAHVGHDTMDISVADAPRPATKGKSRVPMAIPVALHTVNSLAPGGALRGFTFGVGARDGAPVLVVVDTTGEASLAPLDPDRGTLGAEEPLRPLTEALLGNDRACAPRPGEARVLLPFEGLFGLDRTSLRGVSSTGGAGLAVLRWSKDRACLDAVEIPARDDRYDESPGPYDQHGLLRKVIARFEGRGAGATLLLVGMGFDLRQKLACTGLVKGNGDPP